MIYLLLAILGSGVIPVIFRSFEGWRVNLFWAIPINYVTCVVIGNLLAGKALDIPALASQPWIGLATLQGMLLAVNFFARAHRAARRLSVAIPSLLAFVLYRDTLTPVKIAGLLAALVALYLCTAPDRGSGGLTSRLFHLLPILVFAIFGCYFTIPKYLQTYYLNPSNCHASVMSGFVFAFSASIVIGVGKRVFATADFRVGSILAGIGLGCINYVAVYALLRVLALKGWDSSQLYPIYSVGVVAVSTVLAFLCFRERLSVQKTIGLAVGLVAVALLNR